MRGGPARCPYLQTAVVSVVRYGAVVTTETAQVELDPHQAFQMQPIHN